jgi:hypothetical protein
VLDREEKDREPSSVWTSSSVLSGSLDSFVLSAVLVFWPTEVVSPVSCVCLGSWVFARQVLYVTGKRNSLFVNENTGDLSLELKKMITEKDLTLSILLLLAIVEFSCSLIATCLLQFHFIIYKNSILTIFEPTKAPVICLI